MSKNLSSGQKRKYLSSGGGSDGKKRYNNKWKPKRGGPGMLLTCETGRERKCMNEVIEILEYYDEINTASFNDEDNNNAANNCNDSSVDDAKADPSSSVAAPAELSLDDEIRLLQSQNNSNKNRKGKSNNSNNWGLYDTGCKGTVYLLRTTRGCNLIPNTRQSLEEAGGAAVASQENTAYDNSNDEKVDKQSKEKKSSQNDKNGVDGPPEPKKQPVADDASAVAGIASAEDDREGGLASSSSKKWDPIETYKSIITDLNDPKGSRNIPSSRFVTRIIPIEATCFANIDEIKATTKALLSRSSPKSENDDNNHKNDSTPASNGNDDEVTPPPTTFAIEFKKRLCTTVSKEDIINNVAQIVVDHKPNWKVNLSKPDITLLIQICKTLCGISIINHTKYPEFQSLAPNFNVVALREKLQDEDGEDKDGQKKDHVCQMDD